MLAVISIGTADGSVTANVDGYGSFGRSHNGVDDMGMPTAGDAYLDPIGPTESVGTMYESAIAIGAGAERQFLSNGFIGTSSNLPNVLVDNSAGDSATSSFTLSDLTGSLASLNGLSVNLTQALTPVFHDGLQVGALLTQTYAMVNSAAATMNFELVRYADVDVNETTGQGDGGGRVVVNGEEWLVTTNSPRVTNLNPADFFVAIATDGGNEPATNRFEVDYYTRSLLEDTIIPGLELDDLVFNDGPDADQLIDVATYDTVGALRTVFSIAPGNSATFVTYTMLADGVCAPIDILKPDSQRSPRISNVTISGSTSTHAPYAFNGPDDETDVDGSGQQIVTVPVGNANTVEITFCEGVTNLQASHLTITGLRYGVLPVLASNGFSYDSPTRTGKWRFSAPLAADQYLISVSDAITDSDGNHLDGEWTNPKFISTTNTAVSRFPSGNGVTGGNFNFVFTILPGDASLDNFVDAYPTGPTGGADYFIFLTYYHTEEGATFTQADFNGNGQVTQADRTILNNNDLRDLRGLALADWNFDGIVDGADYVMWRDNVGQNVDPWLLGDATGEGQVTNADYDIWRRQFGIQVTVVL